MGNDVADTHPAQRAAARTRKCGGAIFVIGEAVDHFITDKLQLLMWSSEWRELGTTAPAVSRFPPDCWFIDSEKRYEINIRL
jgi:hypothetical protein